MLWVKRAWVQQAAIVGGHGLEKKIICRVRAGMDKIVAGMDSKNDCLL
jgi:hypothetical protein